MDAKIMVPVRAHILKYLIRQYGEHLNVSARGYVPQLLFLMLEKHAKQDPALVRPSQKLIDGIEYFGFPIYVGAGILRKRGSYLSKENILLFNETVDDLIKNEMFHYLHSGKVENNFAVDHGIIRFRDWYGITEDDLTFDNLKRWYYRNRQRIQERAAAKQPFEPQLTLNY